MNSVQTTQLGAFLIALVIAPACEKELTRDEERALLDSRKAEIVSFAKSGQCTGGSQCCYTGLGSKPCGGSWQYVVYYSSLDTQKLFQMISKYDQDEASYNRKWGIISDCSLPPPPDSVGCVNGRCIAYRNGVTAY